MRQSLKKKTKNYFCLADDDDDDDEETRLNRSHKLRHSPSSIRQLGRCIYHFGVSRLKRNFP